MFLFLFKCACPPGYDGKNCQIDINECVTASCNNGTCTDGINMYSCNCYPGFTGTHCEVNIDECKNQPCLNSGACMDGVNSFTCMCEPGWSGNTCEVNIDDCIVPCANATTSDTEKPCFEARCFHGSRCVDKVDDFQCVCSVGYEGWFCSAFYTFIASVLLHQYYVISGDRKKTIAKPAKISLGVSPPI